MYTYAGSAEARELLARCAAAARRDGRQLEATVVSVTVTVTVTVVGVVVVILCCSTIRLIISGISIVATIATITMTIIVWPGARRRSRISRPPPPSRARRSRRSEMASSRKGSSK